MDTAFLNNNSNLSRNRIVSVDLLSASYKSFSFPQEWSEEKRIYELSRYEMFLKLAAKHPGKRATPTREIDEFWHLHMLSPVAYYHDSINLFGRIFDHDGGFGLGEGERDQLKEAFRDFAKRWQDEYGSHYVANFPDDPDVAATKCWHDCENRCWHRCSDATK